MKNTIIIIGALLFATAANCQVSTTARYDEITANKWLKLPAYPDTPSVDVRPGYVEKPGFIIHKTADNTIWVRNADGTAWVLVTGRFTGVNGQGYLSYSGGIVSAGKIDLATNVSGLLANANLQNSFININNTRVNFGDNYNSPIPNLQSVLAAGNTATLPIITSDRIQAGANGISSLGNIMTSNHLLVSGSFTLTGGISVGGNYVSTGNLQAADIYLSEDISANIVTSRQLINNDVSQFVHANYNGDLENLPIPATSIVGLQPFIQKQVYSTLHEAQMATLGATHIWQCNDLYGSSSIVDSKGTALIPARSNTLGTAGLLNNSQTCVFIPQEGAGLSFPQNSLATNAAYTLEFMAEINPMTNSDAQTLLLHFGDNLPGSLWISVVADHSLQAQDPDQQTSGNYLSTTPSLFDIVVDQFGNGIFYQNGFKLLSFEIDLSSNNPCGSFYFGRNPWSMFNPDPSFCPIMRLQDIATYNVALTPAQINAHLIAAKK